MPSIYYLSELIFPDNNTYVLKDKNAVNDVSYSNSTRKLSQTINGATSDILTVDSTPTNGSMNPITSDAVYDGLSGKVDVVSGKQLSTEDFTTAEKTKLDALASGITEGAKDIYGIAFNTYGQITDATKVDSLDLNFTVADFDGTPERYYATMRAFFQSYDVDNMTPTELTSLVDQWYAYTRDDWNGWTTFDDTGVSTGTKGGSNYGLICIPSTDTEANTDDYAGLPLFCPIDVNFICDEYGRTLVTQIDGITSGFERTNPDKFVGVMQMAGYHWQTHTSTTFTDGYSSQPQAGKDFCYLLPEANGRQFVVHSKYGGVVVDNKLRSFSGAMVTSRIDLLRGYTAAMSNGPQYGTESITQISFLVIMTRIKYASLTQDGLNQGCVNYDISVLVTSAEENTTRLLISINDIDKFDVGCGILVGSSSRQSRDISSCYNISGSDGFLVTNVSTVTIANVEYGVLETNASFNFTTTTSTQILSYTWSTGINDNVLGNDGSKKSPGSGMYPAKIQGIEYSYGCYEMLGDVICVLNPPDETRSNGFYQWYVCKDVLNRSNHVTSDYILIDFETEKSGTTYSGYRLISKQTFSNGVCLPSALNGSTTTYTRDGMDCDRNVTEATINVYAAFGSWISKNTFGGLNSLYAHYTYSTYNSGTSVRLSASPSWS